MALGTAPDRQQGEVVVVFLLLTQHHCCQNYFQSPTGFTVGLSLLLRLAACWPAQRRALHDLRSGSLPGCMMHVVKAYGFAMWILHSRALTWPCMQQSCQTLV